MSAYTEGRGWKEMEHCSPQSLSHSFSSSLSLTSNYKVLFFPLCPCLPLELPCPLFIEKFGSGVLRAFPSALSSPRRADWPNYLPIYLNMYLFSLPVLLCPSSFFFFLSFLSISVTFVTILSFSFISTSLSSCIYRPSRLQ